MTLGIKAGLLVTVLVIVTAMTMTWYSKPMASTITTTWSGNAMKSMLPRSPKDRAPVETRDSSVKSYSVFRVLNATEVKGNVTQSNRERTALWKKLRLHVEDTLPQISSLLPDFGYDKSRKNPCWWTNRTFDYKFSRSYYSNRFRRTYGVDKKGTRLDEALQSSFLQTKSPTLLCLPYFLIIGVPKSGTTDLFSRIVNHPQVISPAMKGGNWWSRRRHDKDGPTFLDYIFLFSMTAKTTREIPDWKEKVTGEGSTSTLFDMGNDSISTVELVYSVLPRSKLIVILRDPTSRLFSEYLYFVCDGQSSTTNCSSEDFHGRAERAVGTFQSCMSKTSVIQCLYTSRSDRFGVRVRLGLYHELLQPWIKLYPLGHQLLVVRMEDYSSHMSTTLKEIFTFLDLEPIADERISRLVSLPPQNSISSSLKAQVGPVLSKTRDMLDTFYKPYNERLANLLQDDGYLWMTD